MRNQVIVDCGATHHMFNSPKFFPNSFEEIGSKFSTGDSQSNLLAHRIEKTNHPTIFGPTPPPSSPDFEPLDVKISSIVLRGNGTGSWPHLVRKGFFLALKMVIWPIES
ncbi:hypothetical protein O181_049912 [Austropuccinia psidii MF-1]|uniref:Uncharacterized protein n=1 Tax=Austropuccinia psidii MF-1 TaxID=1389203 RepID=A0A9Q3E2N4_9BASI|nr:hypothetical protein [Austropuccinia psidii MF-1]